jgi:octaprenyl-diphosphate synthase
MGAAVEMLHAATLLHDDILDNSPLRRGKAAAHTVYGATPAILAGDALLAKALLVVSSFGDTRLTACISEAVMRTAEGEMAEFSHLGNGALQHGEYIDIITGKTAWMLRAACELGALSAGADEAVVAAAAEFGLELGIAFQMVDDALDFSPSLRTGKPTGGDVREGKATPPLLLYFAALPEGEAETQRGKFASGAFSEEEIAAVSEAIHLYGHAEAAREMASAHLAKARAALETLPDCPERHILEEMTQYIQRRDV